MIIQNLSLNVRKKHGADSAQAFLEMVLKKTIKGMNSHCNCNAKTAIGIIMGYEYLHQDNDITRRSDSERAAMEQLRNRFDKTITACREDIETFKEARTQWIEEKEREFKKHTKEQHDKFKKLEDLYKERETLCHLYLALENEKKEMDGESRKLILQALFSRSQSGLLKETAPVVSRVKQEE